MVAIISILSTITFGQYRQSRLKANDVRRKADLNSLYKGLLTVYSDTGTFPSNNNIPWGIALTAPDGTLYMKQVPEDTNTDLPYYVQTDLEQKKVAIFSNLENVEDSKYNEYCSYGYSVNNKIYHYVIFSSNTSFTDFGLVCDPISPTNTPMPVATNTPVPAPTNTPVPTATNTPVLVATNTPTPTATRTPTLVPPTATRTPTLVPTLTPTPSCTKVICYQDADSDGYGNPSASTNEYCVCSGVWVSNNTDCCDTIYLINPGATYYTTPHAACAGVASIWDYNCDSAVTYAFGVGNTGILAGRLELGHFLYGGDPDCDIWLGYNAEYLVPDDCGEGPRYVCDGSDPWVWAEGWVTARKLADYGAVCENVTPYRMTYPGVCTSTQEAIIKCR